MLKIFYLFILLTSTFFSNVLSQPEQIHIALAGQDLNGNSNQVRVNWFTNDNDQGYLRYGLNSNILNHSVPSNNTQYLPGHGYHHTAVTHPLELNTTYYYHVGHIDDWSNLYHIKTLSPNQPFTVAMFGDMGWLGSKERPLFLPIPGLESNWSAVPTHDRLEKLISENKIDLITMMGDIAYADDSFGYHPFEFRYEHVYNGYMNWMQNISAKIPFMTVPGNHESECHSPVCYIFHNLSDNLANFTAYNTRFSMPSQESNGVESMWYSFNYGGIHFTMINTETDFPGAAEENHGDSGKTWPAGHFASNGTYMKWLEQDLSKANQERDKKPWIIAVGHRPSVFILDTFSKLFRKYNVDMYISGHLHEYVRFLPTNNSIKSKNHYHNINETTEIIVGSAGCDEMKYVTDTNGKISIVRKEHEKYSFTNNVKLPEKVSKAMGIGLLHYINKTMLHWQLMESYSGKVIDELFITK